MNSTTILYNATEVQSLADCAFCFSLCCRVGRGVVGFCAAPVSVVWLRGVSVLQWWLFIKVGYYAVYVHGYDGVLRRNFRNVEDVGCVELR